ncbi:MAG TPA: hypothetical protein ENI60_00025 [Candidatus Fraserbacteria bacterium]|nr:hypothetical protein [Candidatus Fraserbacteria bacterium]
MDDTDRRLALQQEIMHAVTVITETYEAINPQDSLTELMQMIGRLQLERMRANTMAARPANPTPGMHPEGETKPAV